MPLSETACRNAKPRPKPYKISDAEGMHLLVQPTGSKLWRLSYRFAGRQKTISLGDYPTVGLADARARRAVARKTLAEGRDPSPKAVQPSHRATDDTLEAIAREWFDNQKAGWVPSHFERVVSRLERDVFPHLGRRPITEIEAPDILAVLRRVEDRGAMDIAKRLRQTLGAIFRYAIATGRAKRDPAADLKGALKAPPKVRHFASLRAEQIPDFLARLRRYDGEEQTRLAIKLVMHTFVRTNEIRFAQWTEVSGDLWRIPAERMKMGREHVVPLTRQSKALFARLKEIAGTSP